MKDTAKIRFLEDCAPKDGSGTTYQKGEEQAMSVPSCEHWVRRGKAEYIENKGQLAKSVAVEQTAQPSERKEEKRHEDALPTRKNHKNESWGKGEE